MCDGISGVQWLNAFSSAVPQPWRRPQPTGPALSRLTAPSTRCIRTLRQAAASPSSPQR